jgi:predicted nucleic acid-binding protein
VIVLDTDVLPALMRARPDAEVIAWLDQQPAQSTRIASITVSEARFGIALLSPSRRRREIEMAFTKVLREDL